MSEIPSVRLPLNSLVQPETGYAEVWIMRLRNLPVMQSEMPEQLKARMAQRRMGQKFVLRLLLGAYLGLPGRDIELGSGRFGKPELSSGLAGSGLNFNVSHAGDWLSIVIATGVAVGIDVESVDRSLRWRKLSRRYFSSTEADWLDGMPERVGALQFLKHWTAREALIKAMGGTIAGNISSVVLETEAVPTIRSLPRDWPPSDRWQLTEIHLKSALVAHLASPQRLRSIRRFELIL